MLAPLVVTTPMPSAGLPSWRTTKVGGSTKPWVTVAISPSRNTRPLLSTGVSATALTPSSAPVTRSGTRCEEVSTVPAGRDVVLLGERIEQRLRRDAERRQLGVRELDEDPLVLGAVEIDLGDAGHLQQPLAHAFGGLLQLRVVGAVAGHHVEDGIDVAEFVVDDRAEQARGQLALHVGELLAQQIEQIRHVLRRRESLNVTCIAVNDGLE